VQFENFGGHWGEQARLDQFLQATGGSDPLTAIRALGSLAATGSTALLVLVNFHRFLNSAEVVQALARQITLGKQQRTFVAVLSPVV
jgi:hypothetical protein